MGKPVSERKRETALEVGISENAATGPFFYQVPEDAPRLLWILATFAGIDLDFVFTFRERFVAKLLRNRRGWVRVLAIPPTPVAPLNEYASTAGGPQDGHIINSKTRS